MNKIIIGALAIVALAAFGAYAPTVQATPEAPGVTVTDEACGSVDLLFANPTDGVVQIELRVDGAAAGVFTLAAGASEAWTETFDEDTGSHSVDYRVLPDGDYTALATVESDCEANPTPEPETGSILIVKNADGAGNIAFDFDGDLGNFNLSNDETYFVDDLDAGSYLIDEVGADGWALVDIDCSGADTIDNDVDDGDVRVNLEAGDDATCVFTNLAVTIPEPTATTAPVATPVVIFVPGPEREVIREVLITPPSTGDAGLR